MAVFFQGLGEGKKRDETKKEILSLSDLADYDKSYQTKKQEQRSVTPVSAPTGVISFQEFRDYDAAYQEQKPYLDYYNHMVNNAYTQYIPNSHAEELNQNMLEQGLAPIYTSNPAAKPFNAAEYYEAQNRLLDRKQDNLTRQYGASKRRQFIRDIEMAENPEEAIAARNGLEMFKKTYQNKMDQIMGEKRKNVDYLNFSKLPNDVQNLFFDLSSVREMLRANNAGTVSSAITGSDFTMYDDRTGEATDKYKLDTEEDRILDELRKRMSDDEIEKYYPYAKNVWNDAELAKNQRKWSDYAQAHPIDSSVQVALGGGLGNALSALGAIGAPGERNNPFFTGSINFTNTVQETVGSEIEKAVKSKFENESWGNFWGGAAKFGYNGAISAVQSAVAMGIGSAAGGVTVFGEEFHLVGEALLGAGAAGQTYNDMLNKGYSYEDALVSGSIAGLIETLTEHVSLENLRWLKASGGGLKNLPLNLVKSFVTEGSEEIASDLLNEAWDYFAHGGMSEYYDFVTRYLEEHRGATEAEARSAYAKQFGEQLLESGIIGGFSGMLGAGWTGTANSVRGGIFSNIEGRETGNVYQNVYQRMLQEQARGNTEANPATAYNDLLETATILPEGSKARQNLVNMQETFQNESPSKRQVRQQGKAINAAITELNQTEEGRAAADKYQRNLAVQNWAATGTSDEVVDKSILTRYGVTDETMKKAVDEKKGITAEKIVAIDNGVATVQTSDGRTVRANEAQFKSRDQAALYLAAPKLGYNANTTNDIIQQIDSTRDVPVLQQMLALDDAVRYGKAGTQLTNEIMQDNTLTADQLAGAYTIGRGLTELATRQRQNLLQQARERMVTQQKITVDGKTENIYTVGGLTVDSLKESQKVQAGALMHLAKAVTKNKIILYASELNEDGQRVVKTNIPAIGVTAGDLAPNAAYDRKTGDVYVDINAGQDGTGLMLFHASHEFGHYIKQWNPAKFLAMQDFLVKEVYGDKLAADLIRDQMDKAKANGRTLTQEEAAEEMVADALQEMLTRGDVMEKIAKLKQQDRSLWQKLKDFLTDMAKRIRAIYKGVGPESREAKELREAGDAIQRLADMFAEGLVEAGENFETREYFQNTAELKVTEKFSMRETVEEKPDLIAVHNLESDRLLTQITEWGGFPAPSIAITRAKLGHTKFGDTTVLFDKTTIDPSQSRKNAVYSGDAYTPTTPQVQYKVSEKAADRLRDTYYDLTKKYGDRARGLYALGNYAEDDLNRKGLDRIKKDLKDDRGLQEVFLREKGLSVPDAETREQPVYAPAATQEEAQRIASYFMFRDVNGKSLVDEFNGIRPGNGRRLRFASEHEAEIRAAMGKSDVPNVADMSKSEVTRFFLDAIRYDPNKTETVTDTSKRDAFLEQNAEKEGYAAWIDGLLDGLIAKKGIFNGKEMFYPSGNRRSWEQLHYEYNLENIVRAMYDTQEEQGSGFAGNNLFGASAQKYASVEEIREDEDRLRNIDDDEYEKLKSEYVSRLGELADSFARDPSDWRNREAASDLLLEAVMKRKTRDGIAAYLKKEGSGWTRYADHIVDDLIDLVSDVREMPTGYFEAKPARAVYADEIRGVVLPNNADEKLYDALSERGISYLTYERGNDADRIEKVNTLADEKRVKFSSRDASYLKAAEDGDMETAQRMVDEAAQAAGYTMPLYHGAKKGGGFTVFKNWQYFTENKAYAERYMKPDDPSSFFSVYVKADRMFDTRDPGCRKVFEQYRREYGLGEILKSGLPDWTDGYDLSDIIEENDLPYDGIVLDEGGDMTENGPVSRGPSYVIRDSAQIKSADPVTYDDNGNVIPLTERFNAEERDIRYSAREASGTDDSDISYDRIFALRDELRDAEKEIRAFEESDEFRQQYDTLAAASQTEDLTGAIEAYKKWSEESGYDAMREKVASLRDELNRLQNEARDREQKEAEEKEQAAITKSGLTEADYFRRLATRTFGTTTDFREAGYLLPNGKMLNFTGEKGWHNGSRGQDHRAIGFIYETTQGSAAMNRFVNAGNIRVIAETPGVNLYAKAEPTREQYNVIRDMARRFADREFFGIDLSDENGRNVGSLTYEGKINAERIVNDLKHYFATGEIREQSDIDRFRYSDREADGTDARTLLSNALMDVAQNDDERKLLTKYQSQIAERNAEEAKLNETRREIRDMMFRKGPRDEAYKQKLTDLKTEAQKSANRLSIYDKRLLNLEATKHLKNVLAAERQNAIEKERARSVKLEMDLIKAAGKESNALRKQLQRQKDASDRKIARLEADIAHRKEMRQKGIDQRASTDLRGRIKSIQKDLQDRLQHGNLHTSVPKALAQSVVDICIAIDPTGEDQNSKAAKRFRDTRDALLQLRSEYDKIDTSDTSGFTDDFRAGFSKAINDLAAEIGKTPLRDMSREQLEMVLLVLQQVRHIIVNTNKLLGIQRGLDVDEMKQNIRDNMDEVRRKGLNHGRDSDKAIVRAGGEVLNWEMRWFVNPLRMVREVTGYDNDAELYRLMNDINEGRKKGAFWEMTARKLFAPLTEGKENRKAYLNAAQNTFDFGLKDMDGNELKMSKMQAMTLLLTYEREQQNKDRKHLESPTYIPNVNELRKGNWEKANELAQVMPVMDERALQKLRDGTSDEWCQRYMEAARKVFNEMSSTALNEVSMELIGRPIATEKEYIPYEVNDDFIKGTDENVTFDRNILNAGFTKEVKKNAPQPLVIRGLNDVLDRHIRGVATYYGTAIPVYNWNKVFGAAEYSSTPVRQAVTQAWGKKTVQALRRAVADAQGPRHGDTLPLFGRIKSNWVQATLAFNISVWMKQAASYPTAGAYLSAKALAKGLPYFGKSLSEKQRQAIYDEIDKYTAENYMRRTGMEGTQEMAEFSQQKGRVKQASDALGHISPLNWIQSMDIRTTAALWVATKAQVEQDGTRPDADDYWQKVTDLYEAVIENTQPMYDPMHRAEIAKNKVAQNFIVFQTQPIQNSGILREAYFERKAAVKQFGKDSAELKAANRKFMKACTSQLASHMVFALMTAVAAAALHRVDPWRDDDDELTFGSAVTKYGTDVLNAVVGAVFPVVGSYAMSLLDNVISGHGYDILSDPVVDQVNSLITSIQNLKDPSYKTVSNAITTVLAMFGVPAANAQRVGEAIFRHAEDIINGHAFTFEAGVSRTTAQERNRLYEALVSGDQAKVGEIKTTFKTEEEYHKAVRQTLTEHDDRIQAAVEARQDMDMQSYTSILNEIIGEGVFSRDDVLQAAESANSAYNSAVKAAYTAQQEGDEKAFQQKVADIVAKGYDEDAFRQAVKDYVPKQTDGEDEDKEVQWLSASDTKAFLYKALLENDTSTVAILKQAFDTEKKYHNAIVSALKENDPRIRAAAEARLKGDSSEYLRITKQIIAEKHFTQDDIVKAVNGVMSSIKSGAEEDENATVTPWWEDESESGTSFGFKKADLQNAFATGDRQDIELVISEITADAVAKGKTQEDAQSSAESTVASALKDLYLNDGIDAAGVKTYLKKYSGDDDNDVYWILDNWDYAKEHGKDASYGKYLKFYEAVQTGKNLKSEVQRYLSHGVKASTLSSQITSYFKPIYKEMNNTQRAALKGYLLNAYAALGYNRYKKSKDIDKWLKS